MITPDMMMENIEIVNEKKSVFQTSKFNSYLNLC